MPKPPRRDNKYNEGQITMKNTFAKRLKERRESKGLSHEKLAEELKLNYDLDISKQALINYEVREEYHTKFEAGFGMNITYLWTLAQYFDVSVAYLLGETDETRTDIDMRIASKKFGLDGAVLEMLEKFSIQPELRSVRNMIQRGEKSRAFQQACNYSSEEMSRRMPTGLPDALTREEWIVFEEYEAQKGSLVAINHILSSLNGRNLIAIIEKYVNTCSSDMAVFDKDFEVSRLASLAQAVIEAAQRYQIERRDNNTNDTKG